MTDSQQKATVLIVDDVGTNIDVLKASLEDNYAIKIALNGRTALEIAAKEPHPDIILLDVMMPEMDGYEVCTKLKSDPTTSQIPVLFVTAMDDSQFEVKGFDVGGVDYITKPVVPELVLARVRTHLELKRVKEKLVEYSQRMEKMLDDKLNF